MSRYTNPEDLARSVGTSPIYIFSELLDISQSLSDTVNSFHADPQMGKLSETFDKLDDIAEQLEFLLKAYDAWKEGNPDILAQTNNPVTVYELNRAAEASEACKMYIKLAHQAQEAIQNVIDVLVPKDLIRKAFENLNKLDE